MLLLHTCSLSETQYDFECFTHDFLKTISIYLSLPVGPKCQGGWSERDGGRGGEAGQQLSQRLMLASVCVINHSGTLRRGTIHF